MKTSILFFIIIFICSFGCTQQKVDLAKERKAVSDLLEKNFQANLKGNIEEALEATENDFLVIMDAKIKKITKEAMKNYLSDEFKKRKESGQCLEGKTVTDSVQISGDGKMAWAIRKLEAIVYKDSSKTEIEKKITQVLLGVFEKRGNKWVWLVNSTSVKEE